MPKSILWRCGSVCSSSTNRSLPLLMRYKTKRNRKTAILRSAAMLTSWERRCRAVLSSWLLLESHNLAWNGSGRLELAKWLTDDRQPLTPRVYVNRVWQQLFGSGIVRSSDNFGIRGDLPSHPELLDYLASEFIKQGWSTKKLVRRLVLTSAYRMSANPNPAAHEIDPENRLLWRMNARRLEAETIRDSILAITGKLDLTAGGETLPTHSLETFIPNLSTFNPSQVIKTARLPENLRYRRTVYLPIFRTKQMQELDILNYFDFAEPTQLNASRRATVVPTQSLFLLNSPWIAEQAEVLATKLIQDDQLLDRQRVNELILRIFNRKPAEVRNHAGTGVRLRL